MCFIEISIGFILTENINPKLISKSSENYFKISIVLVHNFMVVQGHPVGRLFIDKSQ